MNFKKGEICELRVCSLPRVLQVGLEWLITYSVTDSSNYKNIQYTLNLGFYEKKEKS